MENNNETITPEIKENDLRSRLRVLTNDKTAGSSSQNNSSQQSKSFYESEDDFAEEPKKEAEKKPEQEKPQPKLTTAMKEASANSIIGLLDITNRVFIPFHNKKLYKKFTPADVKKLDTLDGKEKEDITDPDDLALFNRFEKLLARHKKKVDAVPLNETEKTDLRTQMMAYMDYKEKTLPVEIGLAITFGNIMLKRVIDVATD